MQKFGGSRVERKRRESRHHLEQTEIGARDTPLLLVSVAGINFHRVACFASLDADAVAHRLSQTCGIEAGVSRSGVACGKSSQFKHRHRHVAFVPLFRSLRRTLTPLIFKSGNKPRLRDRLWNWTVEQQERQQVKITGDFLARYFEESAENDADNAGLKEQKESKPSTPNSLADWARNFDLEPLLQKRKEIHRQKREGRPVPQKNSMQEKTDTGKEATAEYLKSLARALRAPSSPYASNIQVKELYTAAKQADQIGERMVAIDLLQTLLMVTPSDARVHRRLARMYSEQGDIEKAKDILQIGLQKQRENPWLWHGLGQLERTHGTFSKAKEYFHQAIDCNPKFAQSYHALGTMEHSQGHIASAMRIIKKGLEFCPTNPRLWHAYGDVYRAAQMLEDAERSYKRAIEHGTPVGRCFAYTAMAAVAYEQGATNKARSILSEALKINNGRHAQGWVALSQLEEAEGNIRKARLTCVSGIAQYERGLLETRQRYFDGNGGGKSKPGVSGEFANSISTSESTTQLLRAVPRYRSGDKFVHLYQNWARLEEKHGDIKAVDRVYNRAIGAFPRDYRLLMSWAKYHGKIMNHERARTLFKQACQVAGHR